MRKDKEDRLPIDEHEFNRLLTIYKQRTDPNRRAPERVEKPIDIRPSVAGARIVNWAQYLEMVDEGRASYPPSKNK